MNQKKVTSQAATNKLTMVLRIPITEDLKYRMCKSQSHAFEILKMNLNLFSSARRWMKPRSSQCVLSVLQRVGGRKNFLSNTKIQNERQYKNEENMAIVVVGVIASYYLSFCCWFCSFLSKQFLRYEMSFIMIYVHANFISLLSSFLINIYLI